MSSSAAPSSAPSSDDMPLCGAVSACSSSDDAMVSLIHRKKLSNAFRRQLNTRHRMEPIEFAHRENIPQFYQLDWQDAQQVDGAAAN
jgi:hypothetical protein